MPILSKGMVRQKRKIEDRGEEDNLAKELFGCSAGFPDGFEDSGHNEVEEAFTAEVRWCIYLSIA